MSQAGYAMREAFAGAVTTSLRSTAVAGAGESGSRGVGDRGRVRSPRLGVDQEDRAADRPELGVTRGRAVARATLTSRLPATAVMPPGSRAIGVDTTFSAAARK